MSTSATSPSASAPATDIAAVPDLAGVVRAILATAPGVVQSIMVVRDVLDGNISGVVLDPAEPGGGYVDEQELAPNTTYLVLGVGSIDADQLPAGISIVTNWRP